MHTENNELKDFNLKRALDSTGDNEELVIRLIEIFSNQWDSKVPELEQALNENNADIAERIAHNIKGSAASIGAELISETAYQLEKSAKSKQLANAIPLISSLKDKFVKFTEQLSQLKREPTQ